VPNRDRDAHHPAPSGARLLADVPDGERSALLAAARKRTFRTGEVVFHEGDPAKELHLIVAGRFAILVTLPTGEEAMLRIMGPGEIFGEMALLEGEATRSATVRSIDAGATAAIDRKAFDDARRLHAGVSDILLSILADRVRQSDGRLLETLFVPAEVRVLRRLVELVDLFGEADRPLTIPLRQEDLASLAGTSRATVNRVLRAEEVRGAVELHRGRTTVLDRAGLEHRAR
jgi:CRP/FNR family transcriptional regulator, cyclic AMP receptor protein